jgi:hypothetical protein
VSVNEELAFCAQVNFENFEQDFPLAKKHPFYLIAKAQLDESLGGDAVEDSLRPYAVDPGWGWRPPESG